ncbi:uncharacterized protein LOC126910517 isoform X2 [Daktulosphaira vitifoliae]|uniref:uncharacterized protein LOC126910517 isoform X2 n=1 Tax=Daktulosphaira vitifoliae TaxID=58002 RepID=UPI0021AA900A|nr:uncharacterized protein LOC126910517 isoform X2 [Daktulosphaira vitifoliae]
MMDQFKVFALVSTLLICLAQKGLCDERQHNGEFKCPEEFGYYPHPSDCSQYYVCVFGGALLESCTGGLMYSHELQTCDWPRNVGCGAEAAISQSDINQENALPLTRTSERPRHPTPQPQRVTPSVFTGQKQTQDQQQINDQHIIKQQQLYDEDDYRAIEDDGDRQQRVYRGQPSTLGQVARDRDGLTNHRNVISPFVGVEKNKQFQLQNQNFRNDTGQLHVKQRFKRQTRLSHSGMTRIRPTDTTVSTTHYALRRVPQNQVIAKPSSYIPITNMDNPQKQKRCLYKSQRYPGLLIPCPSSNNYWGGPPMSSSSVLENEETNDTENSEDDKEAVDDKGDYSDYPENENQEDYEEEESPLQHDLKNADKAFEHLVNRVRCRNKNSCENKNNKEQEDLENQEESQEESPDSKEEEHKQPPKSTPKPKPKPSTTPKPEPLPKLNALRPLTVAHNYRPANFTKLRPPPPDPPRPHYPHPKHDDGDRSDAEEQEEEEDSQESSQLEDVEEYNENDDLADDEYYYDDEEDYDVKPKKPQIPQKLAQIDNMKFSGEGDEPSESISKDTVLKNVSKTIDLQKPNESSSLTLNSYNAITSRPKPYDSAAEAYSRIKDKNKFHDQQTAMQMTVYDTTVSSSVFEDKKKKLKIPTTTTNWTTVSPAKMQSLKPTVRTTARTTLFKRPQQISVPSYAIEQTVQPVTTARTTTTITVRNVSQPFDPTFYNVYDDDSDIYKDVDYGQFTLSSVNNNNNRLKPQPDPFRVSVPVSQATPRYQANTFVPEYNLKVTEEEPQRDQQTKATYRSTVIGVSPFVTDRSTFKFPSSTPSTRSTFTFPTSTPSTPSTAYPFASSPSLYLKPPSPLVNDYWTTVATSAKPKINLQDFRIIVDPYNTTRYEVTTHRGSVITSPLLLKLRPTPFSLPQTPSTSTTTTTTTSTSTTTTTAKSIDFDQEYDVVVSEAESEEEEEGYIDDNSVEKSSTISTPLSKPSVFRIPDQFPSTSAKSGSGVQSVTSAAPTSKPVTECKECNEKPSRGRVRGSATYTTASSNDIDRGTPLSGTRPTLKPSTSIVSKASEFIDVYKYPPKRPDPIYPTPQPDKTAAKCRKDVCQLPDCSCGGKEIPGDLTPEETPQMVLLTFDDSVNDLNKGLYTDLFEKGRVNPNGCPISATFYVSHEWTDYSQVQNLYAAGHEMASHSVSHSFGEQFSQKKWTKEIVGQREILSAYGGVHQEDIRGMRAPFLAVGGNKMFKMLYDSNFTYDSSMPIYENKPPSWPYTLDYKLFHDCMIPPCPTRSYPGVWEVPMVMWQDLNGGRCSMGDACSNPPDAEGVHKMLMKNFDRHFTSNRAPFGLFYHAAWFTQPHHKEGFIQFLDTIVNMPEVWIVTNWQALQWVRDPTSISRLQSFSPFHCDYSDRPKKCNNPKVCNLWHKSGVRYMRTCQPCPDVYPWTGKTGIRSSRIDDGSE